MMYKGQDMLELMKHLGGKQAGQIMVASSGTITSADPTKYMAKVLLQPLGIETGWLPIGTLYAGPGFGLVALPDVGTEVTVLFEHGDLNCGKVLCCNFNDSDAPPAGLLPGEVVMLHKSGSLLKFDVGGDVEINPAGLLKLAGGGQPVARVGDYTEAASGTYTDPDNVVHTITGRIVSGSSKVKAG